MSRSVRNSNSSNDTPAPRPPGRINLVDASSCRRLLGREINRHISGEINHQSLKSISYAVSVLLKILEQNDVERRLDLLEKTIDDYKQRSTIPA